MISIIYGSSTSNWKPWKWMRFDLIFMMRDMYINSNLDLLTKFSTRSRSTEFKGILPWNISQVITKTVPISIRIAISCAMKRVIPFCVWRKNDGNWDKNMIRVSLSREGDCRTNTSAIRNKSKRAVCESQNQGSEYRIGKLNIWERSFEIKTITEFARSIRYTRIG